MKLQIHENDERGYFNQKWIKSYFSFSYADYHNHKRPGFGKLLVLNEDHIQAKEGFPARPHKDMEIISIPLDGELHHKDSLGNDTVVKKGSVQTISAGSGISHSEKNGSTQNPLQVLHIWIESENHDGLPFYQVEKYYKKDRLGKWQLLVSGDKKDECNYIYQDAYISRAVINNRVTLEYKKKNKYHGVYFFIIQGAVKLGSDKLKQKDAAGISGDEESITIIGNAEESDILAIEVPMSLKKEHIK